MDDFKGCFSLFSAFVERYSDAAIDSAAAIPIIIPDNAINGGFLKAKVNQPIPQLTPQEHHLTPEQLTPHNEVAPHQGVLVAFPRA